MRQKMLGAAVLLTAFAVRPATAQKPLSLELGAFGQYSWFDEDLNMENAPTVGGRAALWLWKRFALEADIQYGKSDWDVAASTGTAGGGTKSLTLRPYAGRLLWSIPAGLKNSILIGAGYQNNVFIGREVAFGNSTIARNEYEDAFTALIGVRRCLNDRWNIRGDVVSNHAPSPNFNSDPGTLNGRANTYGLRIGVGMMLRGACFRPAAPVAPAPVAPTPVPEPPAPAPAPTNTAPTLTLSSPSNNAEFSAAVPLNASCRDTEDGDISSRVRWSSNRDGDIGTGASVNRQLTSGRHTITATCTDAGGLTATQTAAITVNQLVVRLSWAYFNFDQSSLTRMGRDSLDRVVSTLRTQADWKVAVEGHTDPYGSDEYNQSLSERRAQTVVDYLTRGGIDPGRISQKGFGEQCLAVDDDHTRPRMTRAQHQPNRRVEVWSVGDQGVASSCRPRQ
jgi:outer membrane protein OmpA-like peptidoglycan-associated protein/opacity protein-like surface antigen